MPTAKCHKKSGQAENKVERATRWPDAACGWTTLEQTGRPKSSGMRLEITLYVYLYSAKILYLS